MEAATAETITVLQSIEQAVIGRLESLAARDFKREMDRLAEERRINEERTEFARLLHQHIAADFGVALDPQIIYANLEYEAHNGYRLRWSFDAEPVEGRLVRAGISTKWAMSLETLRRRSSKWGWHAYRNTAKKVGQPIDNEDPYPDIDHINSEDFIEALVFAKTGKI